MRNRFFDKKVIGALLVIGLLATHASAQVMQSSSYSIQSDSINFGGQYSTSTSYVLEDTAGEIATGPSDSASYSLKAGYQQMQEVFLSLTAATDVVLTPSLGGITGGISNGSTSVTALTDSPSGYQLTIEASTSPAMNSGSDTIADYTTGGDPDFDFTTGATDSHLGYSPEGADIADRFKDNGVDTCNTDTNDTALACWDGLSTTAATIATRTTANHPSGTETVINFRVGIGSSVNQAPGTYIATTTLTLLAL